MCILRVDDFCNVLFVNIYYVIRLLIDRKTRVGVIVYVLDVNMNAPKFERANYSSDISEEAVVGAVLLQLSVSQRTPVW
jgi:hypothetical protein